MTASTRLLRVQVPLIVSWWSLVSASLPLEAVAKNRPIATEATPGDRQAAEKLAHSRDDVVYRCAWDSHPDRSER